VASLLPQNLTQQSGLITRLASDLCRARQKYNYTVQFLSNLRHRAALDADACKAYVPTGVVVEDVVAVSEGKTAMTSATRLKQVEEGCP
jgi:hypothetical protein